jgi:predicted dehydrogenase/phage shock protein A
MPDPFDTTKYDLQEALREIRQAAGLARERVVQLVMYRNQIQDEVERLTAQVEDLERKAALAESINQPQVAEQLRNQRKARENDLIAAKNRLQAADIEADTAKERLREEEARLSEQAGNLQAKLSQFSGTQAIEGALGGSDAEDAWNRAAGKIRTLENEASARAEVAGTRQPVAAPAPPVVKSADDLLAELEKKVGLSGEVPDHATRFIEFDAPAQSDSAEATPQNSDIGAESVPPIVPTAPQPVEPVPPVEDMIFPAPEPTPPLVDVSETQETSFATVEETPPVQPLEPQIVEPLPPATVEPQPVEIPTLPTAFPMPIVKGETARMDTPARVRVAGIGTGGIFRGAHLPSYPDIPQAQLTALVDPDPQAQKLAHRRYQSLYEEKATAARERGDTETAERLEQDFEQVKIYEDIRQVIEQDKPDLVDICTQPNLHVPLSIIALEAGIHVMTEKPISRSWLESERLIEAINRTGKLYQHNENWLWDRDYYTAKKLVDAGAIGEPILMFLAQAHGGPEGNGKFWDPANGGGGALLDNGIHAIGAAWFVVGLDKKPTLVKAADPFGMSIRMPDRILDGRFQKVTVDDDAHILIRFEDDKTGAWSTAHVEGSWSERDSPDTAIIGTIGKIVFKNEDGKRFAVVLDAYDRETRRLVCSGPTWQHWPSSHYGEILNMVECVRHSVPSICTAEFGADNSAIVGATYLSEKNGRNAVHINEFKEFARGVASRYPNDPEGADNALVETLLSAVRDKKR